MYSRKCKNSQKKPYFSYIDSVNISKLNIITQNTNDLNIKGDVIGFLKSAYYIHNIQLGLAGWCYERGFKRTVKYIFP